MNVGNFRPVGPALQFTTKNLRDLNTVVSKIDNLQESIQQVKETRPTGYDTGRLIENKRTQLYETLQTEIF
jgi:hypothetical protein